MVKAKILCYGSHKKSPGMLVYVGGYRYNTRMTTKWTKYSFVCNSECDALIEYTLQAGYTFNDVTVITCACGSDTTCVSVEDATIQPNQTKEEQMESYGATVTPMVSELYNPNTLVTYKKIDGDTVSYPTEKVTDIEWALDQSRRNYKNLTEKQNSWYSKESQLRTLLEEVYENSDDQESLASIAEIFDIPLTKEVEYTAWVRVDLTVEVELGGDTDSVEDFIAQNLTIDSFDSLISVNNYEVDRVEEGPY